MSLPSLVLVATVEELVETLLEVLPINCRSGHKNTCIMSTPRAQRGASTGTKRRAGAHEAQHHRPRHIPPALRDRDEEPSFLELGNDLIFHAMGYLNAESLAKLETVAKAFKRITIPHWKELDKQVPVGCRSSSSVPRTRAIRFHMASKLAASSLHSRPLAGYFDVEEDAAACERGDQPSCEYFVRFVDKESDEMLAQGFTTGVTNIYISGLILPLDKLDLTKWPALNALAPSALVSHDSRFDRVVEKVGTVIIAVERNSHVPRLSLAFASKEYDIDNIHHSYSPMCFHMQRQDGEVVRSLMFCNFFIGNDPFLSGLSSSFAIKLKRRP